MLVSDNQFFLYLEFPGKLIARRIRIVIGGIVLFLVYGCSIVAPTTPEPGVRTSIRATVSAGTIDDYPNYREICLVELLSNEGKRRQYIQPLPYSLSERFAVVGYDFELHELAIVFACGWQLNDENGESLSAEMTRNDQTEDLSKANLLVPFSAIESVVLSFSIALSKYQSSETAIGVINRLLEAGFRLEFARGVERKARLRKLKGGGPIFDPALGGVKFNGASIDLGISDDGMSQSPFSFALGCQTDVATIPLEAGMITVPAMVGSLIPQVPDKLHLLEGDAIDKPSQYKIEAWQFVGGIPLRDC